MEGHKNESYGSQNEQGGLKPATLRNGAAETCEEAVRAMDKQKN